jgi:hypothetical protein
VSHRWGAVHPGLKGDPDTFKAKLDPWANQSSTAPPVSLPATATAQQVATLISAFVKEVKKVDVLASNR